jgi:hypothetical protein
MGIPDYLLRILNTAKLDMVIHPAKAYYGNNTVLILALT